jgi:hypothetical protein
VSHLVSTYQKEIKDAKSKINTACDAAESDESTGGKVSTKNIVKSNKSCGKASPGEVAPVQRASREDTAAAAALSSLAAPPAAPPAARRSGTPPAIACDFDSLAVANAKKGGNKPASKSEGQGEKEEIFVRRVPRSSRSPAGYLRR